MHAFFRGRVGGVVGDHRFPDAVQADLVPEDGFTVRGRGLDGDSGAQVKQQEHHTGWNSAKSEPLHWITFQSGEKTPDCVPRPRSTGR